MIDINRQPISYLDDETGMKVSHYILTAYTDKKTTILSHPNLYLYSNTRSSLRTSDRYSQIISSFYRYLSTQIRFSAFNVAEYHAHVSNKDIIRWQVSRLEKRLRDQNSSPSTKTIIEDARILLQLFSWLEEHGYPSDVKINAIQSIINFKKERLLNYIERKAKKTLSNKGIRVLDKESRQKNIVTLISKEEIHALVNNYHDPVYSAILKFALGTAMRPMEICKFPLYGAGANQHIAPFTDMKKVSGTVDYTLIGKGNKTRKIKINVKDLRDLQNSYTEKLYKERTKKYAELYGHPCPLSILFLNEKGVPITEKMISQRTNYAKKKAKLTFPGFRDSSVFYSTRKWWPTKFLINYHKGDILTKSADFLYAACAQAIMDQMGHDDISTTYKHYIDMARVMVHYQGWAYQEFVEPVQTVAEFIDSYPGHI
ncbi:site-specific integrase [Pseudomonas sp. GM48]|uniref:site-specific integrase n=1 Tax=Pseudomonas sp. GM48 TaxID=1144330 RepID=UPI00026FDDBE|nr:site-specific integrase [Pseudomonas sp. GM48]EJM56178.1 site-specific recombinase XerD [Pseudomonas sp. GM48]